MTGPCGAGEGARAAQTMPAGPGRAGGPAALSAVPLLSARLSFALFLSPLPLPPLGCEGRAYMLLLLGGRSSQGFDGLRPRRAGVAAASGLARRAPGPPGI